MRPMFDVWKMAKWYEKEDGHLARNANKYFIEERGNTVVYTDLGIAATMLWSITFDVLRNILEDDDAET